ncbi:MULTISPECIES: DMT family transporter [Halomonadaceae]|uniref:DMT family transporter n=1 Tax=Halomonadaceae TaxID=28256 RepID=UPI001582060B|nr:MULTISPECIES: DMT family transporter [Halomonas]MDI4636533.1 DMT family transporter [Halomonas sp. BMC7]NUJ60898.1 DMT family transporter [Halomonas taeanensis]
MILKAHLGLLLWALLVGLSFPAVGLIGADLPPMLLTALRFAVAAMALWGLARRAPDRWPLGAAWLLYGLMGSCLAGFFAAMFWAAHYATALSMATLFVSVPLLAFLFGLAAGLERRGWRLPLILAMGAAGALLLALAEAGSQDGTGSEVVFGCGEAVFLLGCMASALYPVLSKWGLARGWLSTSATVRAFWSLALGGGLIGAMGLVVEPAAALSTMRLRDVLVVVYLGLFSSAVTFWLQQRATAVLTPAAVTAYGYLVPFVSMLLLFLQAPDRLGWAWLPGSVLVLAAMALLWRDDVLSRWAARNS